jgi:DNA-binding MarR family transcriptional regulator
MSLHSPQPQSASAVLDDIGRAGGSATPRDLRRRLGWAERTLYRHLAGLVDSGQVVRHGHGQYALAAAESLPLPETGREIVGVLADAGVEAHITAFDVLARFAHQFVYAYPHVVYAEPYAVSETARALADAGFVVVPAGRQAGVEVGDLSRVIVLRGQGEAARRYGVIGHVASPEKAWIDLLRETRRSDLPFDLGEVGRILGALKQSGCDESHLRRYAKRMRYDAWLDGIEQATPVPVPENPDIAALRSGYRTS